MGELERAHAELRDRGAAGWAEEAAGALRRLGRRTRRGKDRGPQGGLEALTEREREIAALVAEGSTNCEIAQNLFPSEKTVESHLTRVYGKLDVARRTQVATALGRGARSR